MSAPPVIVIDWETDPIEPRPDYPPEPVGLAVRWPGEAGFYMAFGHAAGNNCDRLDVAGELARIWNSGLPVLMHHAKFDLAVLYKFFQLVQLPWERVHDTTWLLFLADPHGKKHDLKGAAEALLNWAPEERDAIAEWVWEKREALELETGRAVKFVAGSKPRRASNAFEFMRYVPVELAAPYAIGDVDRTLALFNETWPYVVEEMNMGGAYDRERQLLPIFMENERDGMRCDTQRLRDDLQLYRRSLDAVESALRGRLGAADLNFDADRDVAKVLLDGGELDEAKLKFTPKSGEVSLSKDNLPPSTFLDPQLASALGYRNRLVTCIKMFMEPWLRQAEARRGWISTNWNSTRGEGGGTRTGRPSTSDPNFLNISKDFEGRSDGYVHPGFLGLPALPLVRKYILADDDGVFLHRDFDGQELRVFAHYESGELAAAYHGNPALDVHKWVSGRIVDATGLELERTRVKNVTFSRLYGGGLGAIERQARCSSRAEAQEIANAHDQGLPGRKVLVDEIERIVRRGDPIVTWGGRVYYPEPPGADGRSKNYKLINYLVQGSAADITKQALIEWHGHSHRTARFLVTVYDEINITASRSDSDTQMALLREVMNANRLDVPMLSSGKRGPSWGALEKCE